MDDRRELPAFPPPDDGGFQMFLSEIVIAVARHAGGERGERQFERLVWILQNPARRIARASLERLLGSAPPDDEDLDDVANLAFARLYRSIRDYRPFRMIGSRKVHIPVMHWFHSIVFDEAREFVESKYGSHPRSGREGKPPETFDL